MAESTSAHSDVPVERRTYFHHPDPRGIPCPACGRPGLTPWYLYRDRDRCVWRRWICLKCQQYQDRPEEESA